jgi:TRAP-type C4-dicarboxylate transport system substrate-binding protein
MAFPPYQIVSVSEEIKTPEQFEGKVIRSAGGAMDLVIKSMGGSPAAISIGDTYVALQRGTADGTISALASVDGYKLQELAKAISTNGSFGTFVNVMSVRQDKWDAMDDATKQVFVDCGQEIQLQSAQNLDNAGAGLAKKFGDAGVEMFAFTPEQVQSMSDTLGAVHQDWVERLNGRGLPAEIVLETYKSNF